MGLRRIAASIFAAAAAVAAVATRAADPYPDQPGALSAAELRAATAAMSAQPGADAKLPLTASGRRDSGAYAVFARAPQQVAQILSTQQRVLCASSSGAPWTCAPQLFYRFTQGRLVQSFAYSARGLAEDPQMPFKIVAWAGRCLGPQYAEKTGKPPPPGMPAIAEVVQDAKRVIVTTGAGDAYELTEPPPERGQTCPFALQSLGTSTAIMGSETLTPQRAEAAPQPLESRPPSPAVHPALVWVVRIALLLCALAGIAALVLPFVVRRVRGRRAAAAASTLLTAATVAGAIVALVANRFAGVSHAARSVSFIVPLTGLALASCVVWTVIGILAARPKPKKA